MLQVCRLGENRRRYDEIYFTQLSPNAQMKALETANLNSHLDANWDIFPIAYCDDIRVMDQSLIDDAALIFIQC
jgi:hypothetical protein